MTDTVADSAVIVRPVSRRPGLWARLRRNHLAVFGLAIVVLVVLIALLAPLLPLPDPDVTDLAHRLQKPLVKATGWAPTNWAATSCHGSSGERG